jgi:hypothetical protein
VIGMISCSSTRTLILAAVGGVALLASSTAYAQVPFHKGRELICTSNGSCAVKSMPLVAQCGSTSDPPDADVSFYCGVACATTSFNMIISAAYANRTKTQAYASGTRSPTFFALPTGNKNGRNSYIPRQATKHDGSYYPANGLPTPSSLPAAYTMQNAIYDFAPTTSPFALKFTTLSPSGCGINNWWSCAASNTMGKYFWTGWLLTNNSTMDNAFVDTKQDDSWVTMFSFFHQTVNVFTSGITTFVEYRQVNAHKVAASGYTYSTNPNTGTIRINDAGNGLSRRATIGIKFATVESTYAQTPNGPMLVHQTVTSLPLGANSQPYLKFTDENEIKLLDALDHISMY